MQLCKNQYLNRYGNYAKNPAFPWRSSAPLSAKRPALFAIMNRAVGLSAQLTLRNSGLSAGPKQGAGRSNHPSQELMIAEKYLKEEKPTKWADNILSIANQVVKDDKYFREFWKEKLLEELRRAE